jgi:hypothetical protein
MHLEEHWLKAIGVPKQSTMYVSGYFAGAVGALVTWAGAAALAPMLRRPSVPISVVTAGSVLGLLLPLSNIYDSPAVLLVPWQIAVASLIGLGLSTNRSLSGQDHLDGSGCAAGHPSAT